jgi:hypothetical protein
MNSARAGRSVLRKGLDARVIAGDYSGIGSSLLKLRLRAERVAWTMTFSLPVLSALMLFGSASESAAASRWNYGKRGLEWSAKDSGNYLWLGLRMQTRFSSNLGSLRLLEDFDEPQDSGGRENRYQIQQFMQEWAYQHRGLSLQQELHWKSVENEENGELQELFDGVSEMLCLGIATLPLTAIGGVSPGNSPAFG